MNDVPQDIYCVDVSNDQELRWWCDELVCTESQLRKAVRNVGPSAFAVREHLQGLNQPRQRSPHRT